MEQVVKITMTLEINGQPINASATGAILEIPRPEIDIECMVKDIPRSIIVDLSTVEEVFTIGDLILPNGVRAILDPERHIAHVSFVQEEVEEVGVEEIAEGDDAATPEVISDTPAEEGSEGDKE
jgi:hypothetical protein